MADRPKKSRGAVAAEDRARKLAMDAVLKLREDAPMPLGRCAELAGTTTETIRKWRRIGDQLAVEAGELAPEVLEGWAEVEMPAGEVIREQCKAFAASWRVLERTEEPRHIGNIRRCATGYVQDLEEITYQRKKRRGAKPDEWEPVARKVTQKIIPGDWRASLKLLEMLNAAYGTRVGLSVELQREAEEMSDEEIHEVLKSGFAAGDQGAG